MNQEKPPVSIPTSEKREDVRDSETTVIDEFYDLLEREENRFLTEHEGNRKYVEDESIPLIKRLEWARKKIRDRLTNTLKIKPIEASIEDIDERFFSPEQVQTLIEELKNSSSEIGRGGDAIVLVLQNDFKNLKADECYKIAIDETTRRGRNSIKAELEFQGEFRRLVRERENRDIGVPLPLFEFESGSLHLIAMERLYARSVDDILRGNGVVPDWFDIDRFCDSLEDFLKNAHDNGLYHRDMHFGNVMISQHETWKEGDRMGHVIDFGISGYGKEGMDPYVKEVAGERFTYDDDCGRIPLLRKELFNWRRRNCS